MLVYHFANTTLRDGTPHPQAGDMLPHIPDPKPCARGWHGSKRIIDALLYAPGDYLAQRELSGTILAHGSPVDKYCASDAQTITDYVDVSGILLEFSRVCALRALRVHVAGALHMAGLHSHAEILESLPEDCGAGTAGTAAWAAAGVAWAAAGVAGTAAEAAAWAAEAAALVAEAAAWATAEAAARNTAEAAARVAGTAAEAAAWVAEVAARAAEAAAWAAGTAARDTAEAAARAAEAAARAAGTAARDTAEAAARAAEKDWQEQWLVNILCGNAHFPAP